MSDSFGYTMANGGECMIGDRLKEIRNDYGDTQADLANKLKVSKYTVQSWEQEKSEPSHSMLVSICQLYQVSSDFLLGLLDSDPVFSRNREKKLSDDSRMILKEFTEYLVSREEKKRKKADPHTRF